MDLNNATMKTMTKFVIYLITFSLSQNIFGYEDKALRSRKLYFLIENVSEGLKYQLLNLDRSSLVIEKNTKVSSQTFKSGHQQLTDLDQSFSKLFVKNKYLTKKYKGDPCTILYKLSYRGDELSLCSEDKEKVKVLVSFIKDLEKIVKR